MKRIALSLALLLALVAVAGPRKNELFTLTDPKGINTITVVVGQDITYTVEHKGTLVLAPSRIALELGDGNTVLGKDARVVSHYTKEAKEDFKPYIYKRAEVHASYNELGLKLKAPNAKDTYSIIWRAYDDGVAYRITTNFKQDYIVRNEVAEFVPAKTDAQMVVAPVNGRTINGEENQWHSNFQNTYKNSTIDQWPKDRQIMLPALVQEGGVSLCITEVDLFNYPGMRLQTADGKLHGVFAAYPKETKVTTRGLKKEVHAREDYIARMAGKTELPWRAIQIVDDEKELLASDFVMKLAKSWDTTQDWSWVKPGKVAWDWWNDWNIYGVDFRAGINNDTYKYYIDFASEQGIEYVILDEGWAVPGEADLFKIVPEINLEELISYATERNVGLILWAGYRAFDQEMERVCAHYSKMGIKGFKVDFMDRDDQVMVDFNTRCAEMGAKYKLLIDLHGMYKPTGQQRTWPNNINFEGVYGLEEVKWVEPDFDMVTYDVTYPFIRQVAGPADYTQGAMRNANKYNFAAVYTEPMSQGTRCRQLAEYVIFESPFGMLCDNPSNYLKEDECTRFIASVPWDQTVVLDGKVGEYLVTARRKGDHWYIGAITNWNELDLVLDISMLNGGTQRAHIFRDGANANRVAQDYVSEDIDVYANKLMIHLAKGGGAVIVF